MIVLIHEGTFYMLNHRKLCRSILINSPALTDIGFPNGEDWDRSSKPTTSKDLCSPLFQTSNCEKQRCVVVSLYSQCVIKK